MIKCNCEEAPACSCREAVVCLKDVTYRRASRTVLDGVTFCIDEGVFLGIIGPNGGGKTTLLKLMLGALEPQEGHIEIFRAAPRELRGSRRSVIGYVPQRNEIDKNFPATALDVVLMGAVARTGMLWRIPRIVRDRAGELLEMTGVGGLRNRPIGRMSGGQQQRVFIARALICQPRLLILDEPTAGLDSHGQQEFLHFMRQLRNGFGLTVIMVSHDVGALTHYADQIACLNVRLHWHDKSQLLSEEIIRDVFACELDAYRERVKEMGAA